MTDEQKEEQGYRLLDPADFEGAYTPEEIALNVSSTTMRISVN